MNISSSDQLAYLSSSSLDEIPFIHLYSKDRHGKYIASNDTLAKDVGCKTKTDLFGLKDGDLWIADNVTALRRNDEKVMAKKTPILYIESGESIKGDKFKAISYKFPLQSYSKKIVGIMGISLITEMNEKSFFDAAEQNIQHKKSEHSQSDSYQELKETRGLTAREIDCIYCLAKGMTAKQTADALYLSKRTVENYIVRIKEKLNCESRSELINKALKMKYIKNKLFVL
jgi:DNA-binding CsgD family transcriptional regulator